VAKSNTHACSLTSRIGSARIIEHELHMA